MPDSMGGGPGPTANLYSGPFSVSGVTEIQTRLLSGSAWSALNATSFNGNIEASEARIVDYFDIDSFLRSGPLFSNSWFGTFEAKFFSWVHHFNLRWIFAPGDEQEWLYHPGLSWLWTDEIIFPYIWSHDRQAWLFFLSESGSDGTTQWFFDFSTNEWIAVD